ncbi:MAG: ABC transporter ATP-binding protein, partial [Segetibacter sp.]
SSSNLSQLELITTSLPGYKKIKKQDGCIQAFFPAGTANLEVINQYCFENGIILNHLLLKKKSLEAKFFELTNN